MSNNNPAVMSREQAQALCDRILRLSQAERAQVNVGSGWTGNTRFAANQMSTSGSVENVGIGMQSWFGARSAVATTNDLSDAGLERTVRSSEALARIAPEDPEDMPLLGAQTYRPVPAFFDPTANCTADERARAAMTALEVTRRAGDLDAAGYIVATAGSNALANTAGLFAYHQATNGSYTLTVRTADGTGSGWASSGHQDWSRMNFAGVSERAIAKARASRNPVAIEPGRYTVILEPQAVGDLVQLMVFAANARNADEGRSAFTREGGGNKIGEQVVDPRITLYSDPQDPDLLGQPFDGSGLPLGRQNWIENGVLRELIYSRYWAQRQNRQPTGGPSTIKMVGGTTTVDQMIAGTERGVLVTRLWYLRQVDPRTILYTGLTRDGTFLVENGRISRSIRNFRFNESPLFMLNNLEALGPTERLSGTEAGGNIVMPAIKVRDFNFTSLSEAV
ncbi:MAG: TldD/PmbA family protein [Gemmatimonadales bacterium]